MKRHPALVPLSEDHHHELVQARKLVRAADATADELINKYSESDSAPMALVLKGRAALAAGRAPEQINAAIASFDRVPRLHSGTDAVPQAMAKGVAQVGAGEYIAGSLVNLQHHGSRANRGNGSPLGSEHNFIHFLQLRREFTGDQNAGQVAVIERRAGAPVDQNEIEIADS